MTTLNALLRGLFDALMGPLRDLPAWVGLALFALFFAVVALLVYKYTSNQEQLDAVKRRIHACLFEIRLFNDDLRAILRAQGEILRHNLTYLRLSLVPLAWMLIPFFLIIGQLFYVYGYTGLAPGQSTLVKVELAGDWEPPPSGGAPAKPPARLEVPEGLRVETPALWIPSRRELDWRLAAEEPGDYELTVHLGEESFTKSLQVSSERVRRSPVRPAAGFFSQLLYPAEDPLPGDGPVASISVAYPEGDSSVLSSESDWLWMVDFFVLSIVFALLLRKRLGVTF